MKHAILAAVVVLAMAGGAKAEGYDPIETRQAGQAKRNIAGPVLAKGGDRLLVVGDQVRGDVTRVIGAQDA